LTLFGWCSIIVRGGGEVRGPVKLRVPLVERCDLDLLSAMRPADSEEGRLALNCSVMEKELLGKSIRSEVVKQTKAPKSDDFSQNLVSN